MEENRENQSGNDIKGKREIKRGCIYWKERSMYGLMREKKEGFQDKDY